MGGDNSDIKKTIQQGAVLLVVFFAMLLFARPAHASTTLLLPNNYFPDGYTMTAEGSPYLVGNLTTLRVGANTTVTMEPGAVLKLNASLSFPVQIIVDGTFVVSGTADSPAVITSDKDDAYGGDSNNDGDATAPAPGNWHRIIASSDAARIEVSHALIRYGGAAGAIGYGAVSVSRGTANIADSTIEYASGHGVFAQGYNAFATVRNSVIQNSSQAGVRASIGGQITVEGSSLLGNKYGIEVSDTPAERVSLNGNSFVGNTSAGLRYVYGTGPLDAANSWWGSDSGPAIASNLGGAGDVIIGDVLYNPWAIQTPLNSAPVLSYAGSDGYVDDGAEPDVSFLMESVPVFRVMYNDSDGDVAQYVRLVVGDGVYAMATSSGGVFAYTPPDGDFGKGTYSYHFEASDGVDAGRLPASGEFSFEVRNVPVILVPGIAGSELYKSEDKIWPDIGQMSIDGDDSFMDVLAMGGNGNPLDDQITTGDIVRKPVVGKDVFEGLIYMLVDSGYEENTDLFVFPYDWRIDIRESSQELKDKIDAVKAQSGDSAVDIVAHSMGGLLAKQYMVDNGSNSVRKLIFVGTPHLGAPKAAKTLLFGDNLGVAFIFSILNPARIKYISQNMPAIYELLPSREYIDQSSYYYFDHTQSDVFDYDRTKAFLAASGLNTLLLDSADSFHASAMDNFDANGIDAYNINGCNTPTMTDIIKRSSNEYSVLLYEGDGTVPLASSKAISIGPEKTYYFKSISHATMPSSNGIKELITGIITGSAINLLDNATQDSSECHISGKLVSVHSPVNLNIYDSEGNHVGRGENGDIDYNISGVAYEEIGENKFVFLPDANGVSYSVTLDGTGSGTFSLYVSKVENSQVIETAYYADVPVNQATEAQVTLASNVSGTTLKVDTNGTGSFAVVTVAAVLDTNQASDTTKPVTSISVSGGASSARFELSASDDNSGILKTEYSLDSGETWHTYENQVILSTIGETNVLYRSKDRVGNLEDYHTETISVYSPAVILPPVSTTAPSSQPQEEDAQGTDRHSELDSEAIPTPQVLGAKIERNIGLEQEIKEKYGQLVLDQAGVDFVAFGTLDTQILGSGERAGVLYSYKEAFGALPATSEDWNDVGRIAIGQAPARRSAQAEQRAKDAGASDEKSIMMIAYGLRPRKRDLSLERQGIASFIETYNRLPRSTFDWNILRSIVY